MIKVSKLSKKYGYKTVVDEVSLEFEKGKVISMIGPNGAGKSTILGMISRTINREKGQVIIDDKELLEWDNSELAKILAIMKQSEHLDIKITVEDLITFGRYPYSKGKLNDEDYLMIEEAITYLDLADIRDKYIDELSGGQRQRAYIASIYAQDTDYILLDEPLNNLDIKYASEMLKLLKKMAIEKGKTIILVIHDINFAAAYSDTIVLIKDGKIRKVGSVNDIMKVEVLNDIYEMDFSIHEIDGRKLCIYY